MWMSIKNPAQETLAWLVNLAHLHHFRIHGHFRSGACSDFAPQQADPVCSWLVRKPLRLVDSFRVSISDFRFLPPSDNNVP